MLGVNKELSDRLAQRMWVEPEDEDLGYCFFNARRALFRLTRLGLGEEAWYVEGYAVYFNDQMGRHTVEYHGWVEHNDQAIDTTYASYGRYNVVYFPGLYFSANEVHHRLKTSSSPSDSSSFGFFSPVTIQAYVEAWDYVIASWPEEISQQDLDNVNEWRSVEGF